MIYIRAYGSLIPLTSYALAGQLTEVSNSIMGNISGVDILFFVPSLLYGIGYALYRKHTGHFGHPSLLVKWIIAGCIVIVTSFAIVGPYISNPSPACNNPKTLYALSPKMAHGAYGFVNYFVVQIMLFRGVDDNEMHEAERYMTSLIESQKKLAPLTSFEGKNLIMILVESFGSWMVETEVNGREITPNINRIIRNDKNVLYFPRVLPQVKGGRSSDAQFILNAGLLPLNVGAASFLCHNNTFHALPKMLGKKGYTSVSYLTDDKKFWNQEAIEKSFGFDRIVDRLGSGEWRGEYSDIPLFRYAIDDLSGLQQPFYAQIVTYSMHDPVESNHLKYFKGCKFATKEARNIAALTHLTDSCIGSFVDELKVKGLYDRSIILIVADHDGIGKNKFDGRSATLVSDRMTPMVIINSPLKAETTKVIGEVDIYPSIIDMLGLEVSEVPFRGLGKSVFRGVDGVAAYGDGTVISDSGRNNDSIANAKRRLWTISDILLRADYFKGRTGDN